MLSRRGRSTRVAGFGAILLVLGLFGASPSIAKGGPPVGEETETANNLSVPAVFVPDVGLTLNYPCGAAMDPGDVSTNMATEFLSPLAPAAAGWYYVQGEDKWQAGCTTADPYTVNVTAAWGDNLTSAPLKARTPIRVEMGLLGNPVTYPMTGFDVMKLTDELDRYATYGTLGVAQMTYGEVRVWDADARLTIKSLDGTLTVYDGPATAEINATGRVVYGYNWSKPLLGSYTITFSAPNVNILSADAGRVVDNTVALDVKVSAKASGGGGSGSGSGRR